MQNEGCIRERYQGLEITQCLERFELKKTPHFKEITALIRASLIFIEALDRELINALDRKKYVYDVIKDYIYEVIDKKVNNLWGKDLGSKERQLRNVLKAYSFVESIDENTIDTYVKEIASYDESKVKQLFLA